MIIKNYFCFSLCIISLYFTYSENTICNAREIDLWSRITSSTHENRVHNPPKHDRPKHDHPKHDRPKHDQPKQDVSISTSNVQNFGAKGDGITDDTQAFLKAWSATCKVQGGVMLIPSRLTFLLQPVTFNGSTCLPNIVVQVDGVIVAPPTKSAWQITGDQWILFSGLKGGITIRGNGVIDGRGQSWWSGPKLSDDQDISASDSRPHALRIAKSSNVIVTGITIKNSAKMHIFIDDSQFLHIFSFTTLSPGNSPNTDGIHISGVQHVKIHNSTLASGDDCISIQNGCSDVNIYDVNCGPGHGFSIGGLAPNKSEAHVSEVTISNSGVKDSLTGVRIKTWQDGTGSVHNVTFSNITMTNVKTPICIDQHYCNGAHNCVATTKNAVAIYDITYEGIKGTYTEVPVSLDCSINQPCRSLTLSDIGLSPWVRISGKNTTGPPKDKPFCSNAHGRVLTLTTPPLNTCVLPPPPYHYPHYINLD